MNPAEADLHQYRAQADRQYLGFHHSAAFAEDPRHLAFVLARYKFVAKMLQGYHSVLEIGCGDALGSTLVAQSVQQLTCSDAEAAPLEGRADNVWLRQKARIVQHDIVAAPLKERFDAVYALDVLEHIEPENEERALRHLVASSHEEGVIILGTPNVTASAYASRGSQIAHVNLKSYEALKDLVGRFYRHVFMFGMNDEVLHTGFGPMCHYLMALGVGPRLNTERVS